MANWLKAVAIAIPGAICYFAASSEVFKFIGALIFVCAILFASLATSRTPCPRCGKKLGLAAQQNVNMRRFVPDRCRN